MAACTARSLSSVMQEPYGRCSPRHSELIARRGDRTVPLAAGFSNSGAKNSTASEDDLNRLGFYLGAGAQTHTDQGPEGVHKADIATAEHLGRRVAEQTRIYIAGRAAVGV
ncbi:hypothetical protein GCM10022206_13410 [Streptomyces chiangmaiensis]